MMRIVPIVVPIFACLLAAFVPMPASAGAEGQGHAQAPAPAIFKCRVDGKLGYSDRPCPGGQGEALPPSAAGIPAGAAIDTAGGDSRSVLELEKLRTERARQEVIENREGRAQAREGRVRVRTLKHCDKLRLQHRWLEEDLARAQTPRQQATARTKLRRQAESMAVECPS